MDKNYSVLRSCVGVFSSACVLAAGAFASAPASAFQFGNSNFTGNWDNTLSYGIASRVQGRDKALLGSASTTLPNGPPDTSPANNPNFCWQHGAVRSGRNMQSPASLISLSSNLS